MGEAVKAVVIAITMIMLIYNSIGCATARPGNNEMQLQQLQTRVHKLEKQLQVKEEEIYNLEDKLIRAKEIKSAKKPTAKKPKALSSTPKRIQIALKNAGFYKGPIDGKIGKDTRKAIKEFQKANGLIEDGAVGKKTWSALEKHFSK